MEKTLSGRPAGFGQKVKEDEESKCRNVKSVPRPAGQLASVKTFEKLAGVQKNGKNVGRPVGRLRPKGERGGGAQSEAKQRAWLRSLFKNTFLTKSRIAKIILGNQLARYIENQD